MPKRPRHRGMDEGEQQRLEEDKERLEDQAWAMARERADRKHRQTYESAAPAAENPGWPVDGDGGAQAYHQDPAEAAAYAAQVAAWQAQAEAQGYPQNGSAWGPEQGYPQAAYPGYDAQQAYATAAQAAWGGAERASAPHPAWSGHEAYPAQQQPQNGWSNDHARVSAAQPVWGQPDPGASSHGTPAAWAAAAALPEPAIAQVKPRSAALPVFLTVLLMGGAAGAGYVKLKQDTDAVIAAKDQLLAKMDESKSREYEARVKAEQELKVQSSACEAKVKGMTAERDRALAQAAFAQPAPAAPKAAPTAAPKPADKPEKATAAAKPATVTARVAEKRIINDDPLAGIAKAAPAPKAKRKVER